MVKRTSLLMVSLVIGIVLLVLGSSSVLLAHVETGIETVDSVGDVGKASCIAIDSKDNLHVSFHVSDSLSVLKYATYHQEEWIVETVDSDEISSRMISLCLDFSDNPHVLYQADYELRYAIKTGGSWEIETIEYGSYKSLSLALDTNDEAHISFSTSADTTGYVYYAHKEGDDWIFEKIETFDAVVGAPTASLSLDSVGNPHVVYTGYNGQFTDLIKYAYKNGDSWITETIDSETDIGLRGISIALDSNDQPHLSYSSGDFGLRYAFKSANKWTIEDAGLLGRYCSLALDSSETAHISGLDSRGDLKYAYKRDGRWNIQTVDSTGYFGYFGGDTSLAVDSHGNPHISYYDEIDNDLKHFSGAKAHASPLSAYARTLQPFSNILLMTGTAAAVASVSIVIWEEKSDITEKFTIPIGTEKIMKASGFVGIIISLISAPLSWVTVYPYNLLNYYSHPDLTIKGLEMIYVIQGYKNIALALGFALATYPLALLLGIAALFSTTRKMLSIRIVSSGTLAVLSGLTWIYGVEAAKGAPVWGGGTRPSVGIGAYAVIIAGSILLASYCICKRLKQRARIRA